jgi:4-aminobutyrate aminotransferase / (S)-3-amino-2-methylpropionate transaminase / 5-aminovalerate transaminase
MAAFDFARTPVKVPPVKTDFRCIKTAIPVPQSIAILERLYKFESRSMHGQMPIVWDRAKDFQVFDKWGNCWIDFTSTIFVANAGHANDAISAALRDTLDQDLLHTYTYASEVRADFLQELIERTPPELEKAYLVSAGTEATETAFRLIRLYADKKQKRCHGVIAFDGSFHGRTLGAAQISGTEAARKWIGYEDPNVFHLPFPYPWDGQGNPVNESGRIRFERDLENLKEQGIDVARDLGGVIFESYIGWAAAFFPPDYVQAWAECARANDFLITFDEIQSGFGRTGKLFAYQHYDVTPDIICCGKGISSSLPLAAVLGRADVLDLPDVGSMSSTHSANPLSCAAGLANLHELERLELVEQSRQMGDRLHRRLNDLKRRYPDHISHILGAGMLAALIVRDPVAENGGGELASRICESALRKGLLLVHTGRESIKIGPPLTIPESALIEGLDVLEQCIDEVLKGGSL